MKNKREIFDEEEKEFEEELSETSNESENDEEQDASEEEEEGDLGIKPESPLDSPEINSNHEEDEEENIKKHNKHTLDNTNKRIRETLQEKYQALKRAEILEAENEQLRKMNEVTSSVASLYHEDLLKAKFDSTKELYEKALESGDTKMQAESLAELSMVAADYKNAKNAKAQSDYYAQQEKLRQEQEVYEQQNITPDVRYANELNIWRESNPWFNAGNPEYFKPLAEDVELYANSLDATLYRRGEQHMILSPLYFQKINEYAEKMYREKYARQVNQRRDIPMKNVSGTIAPVRNRSHNPVGKIVLTQEEKEFAKVFRLTEDDYRDEIEKEIKKGVQPQRRRV